MSISRSSSDRGSGGSRTVGEADTELHADDSHFADASGDDDDLSSYEDCTDEGEMTAASGPANMASPPRADVGQVGEQQHDASQIIDEDITVRRGFRYTPAESGHTANQHGSRRTTGQHGQDNRRRQHRTVGGVSNSRTVDDVRGSQAASRYGDRNQLRTEYEDVANTPPSRTEGSRYTGRSSMYGASDRHAGADNMSHYEYTNGNRRSM